ncbi:MAG: hypothetical protein K8I00_02810, partial [Candidatus Omnitrophica bacterium]|nr:hypothetical protein [Candidatus Omnitrophota bacterium]
MREEIPRMGVSSKSASARSTGPSLTASTHFASMAKFLLSARLTASVFTGIRDMARDHFNRAMPS